MSRLRILVVDDHQVVREGLVQMLNNANGLEVVAETDSGVQAVNLIRTLQPDVALLDVSMPDLNGIEVAKQVANGRCRCRVIALTMHADSDFAYQFLEAGGKGYWLKESGFEELVDVIKKVAAGREVIAPKVAPGVERKRIEGRQPAASKVDELTFRERQVLQMVCHGRSSKQIARQLKISTRTVEQHRAHLMEKAGVSNTAALVAWAVGNKIVPPLS